MAAFLWHAASLETLDISYQDTLPCSPKPLSTLPFSSRMSGVCHSTSGGTSGRSGNSASGSSSSSVEGSRRRTTTSLRLEEYIATMSWRRRPLARFCLANLLAWFPCVQWIDVALVKSQQAVRRECTVAIAAAQLDRSAHVRFDVRQAPATVGVLLQLASRNVAIKKNIVPAACTSQCKKRECVPTRRRRCRRQPRPVPTVRAPNSIDGRQTARRGCVHRAKAKRRECQRRVSGTESAYADKLNYKRLALRHGGREGFHAGCQATYTRALSNGAAPATLEQHREVTAPPR
jgi:hypothetical protein